MLCFFSSLCLFPSPGLPATLLRFEPEQTGVFLLIPLSSPLPATLLRLEPAQTDVFLLISLSFPLSATCWDSKPRRLVWFFSSLCLSSARHFAWDSNLSRMVCFLYTHPFSTKEDIWKYWWFLAHWHPNFETVKTVCILIKNFLCLFFIFVNKRERTGYFVLHSDKKVSFLSFLWILGNFIIIIGLV